MFVTPEGDALWVSSWPFAEYTKHEWAGAWVNSTFRNESSHKASELIREALAATRFEWPEVPELGMVTFIDREKVRPTIVRGKQTWGRSYLLAGFKEVGLTKTNRLLAFQILKDAMPEPMPSKSTDRMTKSLFGEIDS